MHALWGSMKCLHDCLRIHLVIALSMLKPARNYYTVRTEKHFSFSSSFSSFFISFYKPLLDRDEGRYLCHYAAFFAPYTMNWKMVKRADGPVYNKPFFFPLKFFASRCKGGITDFIPQQQNKNKIIFSAKAGAFDPCRTVAVPHFILSRKGS